MKQYELSVHLLLELWHFLTVPVFKHKENKIWIYVLTLTMIRIDPQFFKTLLLVQLNDKILKSLNIFILLKIRKFCLKQPISLWQPPKREIESFYFFWGGGGTYQQRYPFLSLSMDNIYDSNNLWTLQFLFPFALYSMITIMWPLLIFLLVSLLSFYFWKCMYQNYSLNTPTCNIAPAKQWSLVTTPIMNNYCITTLCK